MNLEVWYIKYDDCHNCFKIRFRGHKDFEGESYSRDELNIFSKFLNDAEQSPGLEISIASIERIRCGGPPPFGIKWTYCYFEVEGAVDSGVRIQVKFANSVDWEDHMPDEFKKYV